MPQSLCFPSCKTGSSTTIYHHTQTYTQMKSTENNLLGNWNEKGVLCPIHPNLIFLHFLVTVRFCCGFFFFYPKSSTSSTPRHQSYKGHGILVSDTFIPVFTKKAKALPVDSSSRDTFIDSLGTSMFENLTL